MRTFFARATMSTSRCAHAAQSTFSTDTSKAALWNVALVIGRTSSGTTSRRGSVATLLSSRWISLRSIVTSSSAMPSHPNRASSCSLTSGRLCERDGDQPVAGERDESHHACHRHAFELRTLLMVSDAVVECVRNAEARSAHRYRPHVCKPLLQCLQWARGHVNLRQTTCDGVSTQHRQESIM